MIVLIKSNTVTTRKSHQCFSCLRTFPANTKMNAWAGKYQGDFNSGYSCMTCVEIMNSCEDEDGYPEGFVNDMLEKGQTPEQLLEEWKSREKIKEPTLTEGIPW